MIRGEWVKPIMVSHALLRDPVAFEAMFDLMVKDAVRHLLRGKEPIAIEVKRWRVDVERHRLNHAYHDVLYLQVYGKVTY